MPDQNIPQPSTPETTESFGDMLSQYERSHARKADDGPRQLEGTVVAVTSDSVLLDIGYKTEGILPLSAFDGESVKPGDKLPVNIKGRDPEGYYDLARGKVRRPTDWAALEKAFNEKETIAGTVIGVVKGGFSVDVGIRAFMPVSRSGVREEAEMEKLVGQEIRCRIIKLDVTEEDVVVDRRAVTEEEERAVRERKYSELKEGETVNGTVRSLTDYGAFVDIGGVDALLHVGDIAWGRVSKPADALSVGQQVEGRVLKIEPERKRISIGLKQLQPHPWDAVAEKYKVGERVRGTVTRLMEFGAFVELEPGVEGLIHISEMSWAKKKVRKASDVVKTGDTVEVVILGVNTAERRISLGLKQALGDPWSNVAQKYPLGAIVEGKVVSLQKFGAFLQLDEGVEGMIHVGDISPEKRIDHPQDVLRMGQTVKAQVLEIDSERRRLKLGIKQMAPSSLDEYIVERKQGDSVTGRIIDISGGEAQVELGQGVRGTCKLPTSMAAQQQAEGSGKADLSSLSSMLQARWKGASGGSSQQEAVSAGQIRSFRISKVDQTTKKIELELV